MPSVQNPGGTESVLGVRPGTAAIPGRLGEGWEDSGEDARRPRACNVESRSDFFRLLLILSADRLSGVLKPRLGTAFSAHFWNRRLNPLQELAFNLRTMDWIRTESDGESVPLRRRSHWTRKPTLWAPRPSSRMASTP